MKLQFFMIFNYVFFLFLQHSCQTTVRRNGNQVLLWKNCKEGLACTNNEIQVSNTPNFSQVGGPIWLDKTLKTWLQNLSLSRIADQT